MQILCEIFSPEIQRLHTRRGHCYIICEFYARGRFKQRNETNAVFCYSVFLFKRTDKVGEDVYILLAADLCRHYHRGAVRYDSPKVILPIWSGDIVYAYDDLLTVWHESVQRIAHKTACRVLLIRRYGVFKIKYY